MIHIIYVVDDGVSSLRCGVGTIARNFILSFPEIAKHFSKKGLPLKLSVIAIKPNEDSLGLRKDFLAETKTISQASGGDVYLIPSLLKSTDNYFDFNVWKHYNDQANNIIDQITTSADSITIVIANDTIFAHTYGSKERTLNVWIPHSLSTIHGQSYVSGSERLDWELKTFDRAKNDHKHFLGYLAPFVKVVLKNSYGVAEKRLISFRNGFYLPDLNRFDYSEEETIQTLKDRSIPTDKKILFSFGRADEYKGLDISLGAMIKITKEKPEYHGVLIASRFSKEDFINGLQTKLQKMVDDSAAQISLFLGYEFELPKYLLKYKKTEFLFNLPTRDFCPLVPFEAQLIGHDNLCVINSDLPCFEGILTDEKDSFLCKPEEDMLVKRFNQILDLPEKERQNIISAGRENTRKSFDLKNNYMLGISELLSKIT